MNSVTFLLQGNRENIDSMAGGSQKILSQVLKLIDQHDLYGSVAYPKRHQQKDISDIYLLPFATRGIFTNVALQEPFGLTVIEVSTSTSSGDRCTECCRYSAQKVWGWTHCRYCFMVLSALNCSMFECCTSIDLTVKLQQKAHAELRVVPSQCAAAGTLAV
jgi:hypothetical protein